MKPMQVYLQNAEVYSEEPSMRLTLNTLLALLIQAKIKGKGRIGNGRLWIRLLSVLADCPCPELTKERNLLRLFSEHTDKPSAYRQINRFLFDFIPTGNGYAPEKLTVSAFEKNVGIEHRTNWLEYRRYLAEIGDFCAAVLEPASIPSLVAALLELLQEDDSISYLYYGGFIPKQRLSGTQLHPTRICTEALLLGILYHTLKCFSAETVTETPLPAQIPPYLHILTLGSSDSIIFWRSCTELQALLQPEYHISVKEVLCRVQNCELTNAYPLQVTDQNTPLVLTCQNGAFPELCQLFPDRHLLLYGAGTMGKTFLMQHQNGLYLSLSGYHKARYEMLHPTRSNWIILHLLLKYLYHSCYATYESCAACEGEETLLRQLSEMQALFSDPAQHQIITILLDGMNEMPPEAQDAFAEELMLLCGEWRNVRFIVSSRILPEQPIFRQFRKIELTGIPDSVRDSLLSGYGSVQDSRHLREILCSPLFLRLYLSQPDTKKSPQTCGELLDIFIRQEAASGSKTMQFVLLYALPFLAFGMDLSPHFRRSDVLDAIHCAVETFLLTPNVYQNLIAPMQYRKQKILHELEELDVVSLLIEQYGLLTVADSGLSFTHDVFRDYFFARYVIHAVHALEADSSQALWDALGLDAIWRHVFDEPYQMLGEVCGDTQNAPDKANILQYHRTELDTLLDFARVFHADQILWNVLRVMQFSRKGVICGVDFSELFLPLFFPADLQFSDHGRNPCNFRGCRIYQLPHLGENALLGCDFRDVDVMRNPALLEKLHTLGALTE